MSKLDCIIIGFYEVDFNEFAQDQKRFMNSSGAYSELKTNSVLLNGERRTYTDLLNRVLSQATGTPWQLNPFELPSLGVAYLASFLRKQNFSVEIINFFNSGQTKLAELLFDSPKTVAITTTYYVDDEPIKRLVKFIKQHNPEVKIIIGGPRIFNICNKEPVYVQYLIFRALGADIYINDSQGESTLANVLACLRNSPTQDLASVPNLIYKVSTKTFRKTARIAEDNDLNENVINWDYFDSSFYVPTTYMRTSRSCPYSCSFCNYPAFAGSHTLTNVERIEFEMNKLYEAGVKYIIFVDDTFNVPLPRFKEICRMMIRNKFNFKWLSFLRCANVDDEAFTLIAESGCIGVFLGIESGDQKVLHNMNKRANLERYQYGIQKLTAAGVLTLASLIVGFPGETRETVLNTIDFLDKNPTTFYNVQLNYHDTLAPIEYRREEFGITGSGYSWQHKTMDWKEAIEWKEYMIKNIQNSIQLPLYGLSIWALPYLLQHNISINQIFSFVKNANQLLIKSLPDIPVDFSQEIEQMCVNFETLGKHRVIPK